MRFLCNKCGNTAIYLVQKGSSMVGAYCMDCGAWVKWVGKKDLANLNRLGYYVQPEGYVSPTVKIKQEQIAKDKELLESVTNTKCEHKHISDMDFTATCSHCGELDEHTVIVKVRNGNMKGLYCKHCGKWIKWLSEKQFNYLSQFATDEIEVEDTTHSTPIIRCRKCGQLNMDEVYLFKKDDKHIGLYCKNCSTWIKWVGKKEFTHLISLGVSENIPNNVNSLSVDRSTDVTKDKDFLAKAIDPSYDEDIDSDDCYDEDYYANGYEEECDEESCEATYEEVQKVCDFCNGNSELIPIVNSKVDLTYFGGVLSIVDDRGTDLLGSYKLSFCPSCGRKL